MFRLVESVKQSKEKVCEDESVPAMMCIAKLTGCVVLPRFPSSYRQVQRRSVLSRVTLYVGRGGPRYCVRLVSSFAGYR